MDRFEEFNGIIDKIVADKREIVAEEPLLRNRNTTKACENSEVRKEPSEIFNFSKSFISECSLTNSTIIQLTDKLRKLSQKSDQITFSITSPSSTKPDNCKEIDEALNICSLNISVMRRKLQETISRRQEELLASNRNKSLFSSWFGGASEDTAETPNHPIYEHLRLVLSFLEIRVGRLTEEMEVYKARRRNRELLMNPSRVSAMSMNNNNTNKMSTSTNNSITDNNTSSTGNSTKNDQVMSMLQVENTRMLEEMSRGLFETLSTTESQVLELSRLQSTLQSHLTIQHDLTCRLFDDSITTVDATAKGNEYLRRSGKEGSVMRKFLVAMILGMSLLLLLLHYFNK